MSSSLPESTTYLDLAAAALRIPSRSFFSTGMKSSSESPAPPPDPDSLSQGLAFLLEAFGLAGDFFGFTSFSFFGFFSFGGLGP
jgi:hypothetical protein